MNSEQIKRKIYNLVGKAINSIAQNEAGNTSDIPKTVTEGAPELICNAGIEGSVLLRNDGVLPFSKNEKISVFGRCQYDWFYVGYGSGGDVIKPYTVNLIEGLEKLNANLNEPLKEKYKQWCNIHLYAYFFERDSIVSAVSHRSDHCVWILALPLLNY